MISIHLTDKEREDIQLLLLQADVVTNPLLSVIYKLANFNDVYKFTLVEAASLLTYIKEYITYNELDTDSYNRAKELFNIVEAGCN